MADPHSILKKVFGYDSFRPGQEEIVKRLLGGQDVLASRVQKLLPGLDLQLCRKREGQLLTLADGYWSVHSSTVPGEAESVTLLVLNEETELRRIEAEYKASRPGYLAFQLDGYDDVFKIASNRLPAKFGFMIAHPVATVAPVKLAEYKIHLDPPFLSGSLVEGRIYYDAFVLENKAKGIYYQAIA